MMNLQQRSFAKKHCCRPEPGITARVAESTAEFFGKKFDVVSYFWGDGKAAGWRGAQTGCLATGKVNKGRRASDYNGDTGAVRCAFA